MLLTMYHRAAMIIVHQLSPAFDPALSSAFRTGLDFIKLSSYEFAHNTSDSTNLSPEILKIKCKSS